MGHDANLGLYLQVLYTQHPSQPPPADSADIISTSYIKRMKQLHLNMIQPAITVRAHFNITGKTV